MTPCSYAACSKTEDTVRCLSYLSFLRNDTKLWSRNDTNLSAATEADWFKPDKQRWVLERRLATLVKNHIDASNAGKDTSFTVHELTMAHCDFVYWQGFWDVVNRAAGAEFVPQLEALAQVVSALHIFRHRFSKGEPIVLTADHNSSRSPSSNTRTRISARQTH
jgi:acyl-CoA oxidase